MATESKTLFEKYSEGQCKFPAVVEVDSAWMAGKKLYSPMTSTYTGLRTANEYLQKPLSEITLKDLDEHCVMTADNSLPGEYSTVAYGGTKKLTYLLFPGRIPGSIAWKPKGTEKGSQGTSFFVLTDNTTFALAIDYWDMGLEETNEKLESGWLVTSTLPKLSIKTKEQILNHVKALGFNPDFHHEPDYVKYNTN